MSLRRRRPDARLGCKHAGGAGGACPRASHPPSLTPPAARPAARAQDLPGALTEAQVAEGLGLTSIKSREWSIFKTSAIKGEGLFEGLDWLSNALKTRRR
jgi:hypothetical protein